MSTLHYIYLLRTREFARMQESVYKIGKTTQEPNNRLQGYPPKSEIILVLRVHDCHAMETILLRVFRRDFVYRREFGAEYFEGDPDQMCQCIVKTVYENQIVHCADFSDFALHTKSAKRFACTVCNFTTPYSAAFVRHRDSHLPMET